VTLPKNLPMRAVSSGQSRLTVTVFVSR
jgi:hypothetical protein